MVEVPMTERQGAARVVREVPIRMAQECLEDELHNDKSILEQLNADPNAREKCVLDAPVYTTHPIVEKARCEGGPKPIPCGIYIDGVTYHQSASGRQDSVTGIWLVNLLSNKRHLLSTLRHSEECACGCRGWCSVYPLLSEVRRQFISMGE
eukprot:5202136-Pyramimonas_sp.AAC.1